MSTKTKAKTNLLTTEQAAKALGLSVNYLKSSRVVSANKTPLNKLKFVKKGHYVFYREHDINVYKRTMTATNK